MPVPIHRRQFLAGVAAMAAAWLPLTAALSETNLSAAEKIIRKYVDSGVLKSAVLQVQEGRTQLFRRSYGVDSEAVFLIASITKPMTVTGLMVLADRGELKTSDAVMKFIPEFRVGDRRDITIKHLLTHTSGLPDQLPENAKLRQRHAPLSDFVAGAIRTPLLFKPGTRYSYQSMGVLLAAEIVQRISKTTIADFLAKEVFQPLGMNRSALGLGRF
ncbi:MAG: serine hydrolase domain-containing protein, partial [Limisphaerales bacterium]